MPIESSDATAMIVVIERDEKIARETSKKLSSLTEERLAAPITLEAGNGEHALKLLLPDKIVEPCLIVTDREGVEPIQDCVVRQIRKAFVRPKIILYSSGATGKDFKTWKDRGLVDEFVRKQEPRRNLLAACLKALKSYFDDDVLNAARDAVSKHPDPSAEYIIIDGHSYSPLSLMRELIRKTKLGKELIESHRDLSSLESQSEGQPRKSTKSRAK